MSGAPQGRWRGLLVSVRDAVEAAAAAAGGAAFIDVKDPARGPLGAAEPETAAACGAACGGRPWTLACGELTDGDPADAVRRTIELAGDARPVAAKAGCAGLTCERWRAAFAAFAHRLPAGVEAVPVAYADWPRAAAPDPRDLIAAAADVGCRVVVLDTFDKAAPGILSAEGGRERVADWIERSHGAGLRVAVAGRLTLAEIPVAQDLGADIVAVRSAACGGDRFARVQRRLVAAATLAFDRRRPAATFPGRSGGSR